MVKSVTTEEEVQTNVIVLPHILINDQIANVYTDIATQTSITCLPGDSVSVILPQLKSYLSHHHNGKLAPREQAEEDEKAALREEAEKNNPEQEIVTSEETDDENNNPEQEIVTSEETGDENNNAEQEIVTSEETDDEKNNPEQTVNSDEQTENSAEDENNAEESEKTENCGDDDENTAEDSEDTPDGTENETKEPAMEPFVTDQQSLNNMVPACAGGDTKPQLAQKKTANPSASSAVEAASTPAKTVEDERPVSREAASVETPSLSYLSVKFTEKNFPEDVSFEERIKQIVDSTMNVFQAALSKVVEVYEPGWRCKADEESVKSSNSESVYEEAKEELNAEDLKDSASVGEDIKDSATEPSTEAFQEPSSDVFEEPSTEVPEERAGETGEGRKLSKTRKTFQDIRSGDAPEKNAQRAFLIEELLAGHFGP